jgi:hypothetical protein
VYTTVNAIYHISTLVLLRQPTTDWPVLSARPSCRLLELLLAPVLPVLYTFVVFGARPGGALLGALGVSSVLHYVGSAEGRHQAPLRLTQAAPLPTHRDTSFFSFHFFSNWCRTVNGGRCRPLVCNAGHICRPLPYPSQHANHHPSYHVSSKHPVASSQHSSTRRSSYPITPHGRRHEDNDGRATMTDDERATTTAMTTTTAIRPRLR